MQDNTESQPEPLVSQAVIRWGGISPTLLWLHQRAWPLGGLLLFVSVWALRNYLVAENVPVGVSSPAFIAALPTVLISAGFLCLVLLVLLLTPGWVFFVPIANGRCMADRMLPESFDHRTQPPIAYGLVRSLPVQWMVGNVLIAGSFLGLTLPLTDSPYANWVFSGLLLMVVLGLMMLMCWMAYPQEYKPWRQRFAFKFVHAALMSANVQAMLHLTCFLAVLRLAHVQPDQTGRFVWFSLGSVLILTFLQCLGVGLHRLINVGQPRPQWTILALLVFAALVVLWSPSGNFLMGAAMRLRVQGQTAPLKLCLAPGAAEKYMAPHASKNRDAASQLPATVQIPFDTGDWLYVRAAGLTSDQAPTWRIAAADVLALRACNGKNARSRGDPRRGQEAVPPCSCTDP